MDKSELKSRLEAAEKQNLGLLGEIKYLKKQLAEMQDEPEIPDFPTYSAEPLYFIDNRFGIIGDESNICNGEASDYNMFHTKEMAQEFAKKCKLIAMMLHCKWYLCRDYKEDFEDAEYKWYVYYADNTSRFETDYCVNYDHGAVYFDTEENAQKCADWLNAHWKDDGNGI